MANTLVVYESRYGTAKRTAETIARMLSMARCCSVHDAPKDLRPYQNLVLVFGFYGPQTARSVKTFLTETQQQLSGKQAALVGVGLSENDLSGYCAELEKALGYPAVLTAFVPGECRLEALSQEDWTLLNSFSERSGLPFQNRGAFQTEHACDVAQRLVNAWNKPEVPLEGAALREEIEKFLRAHNTCALATGWGEFIRCTPIEYRYQNGKFYIISEGGQKFRGLTCNGQVSLGIFDSFEGWGKLGGLQVTGRAEEIPLWSDEYRRLLALCGLSPEKLFALPIDMHLLEITPEHYEFLSAALRQKNVDTKQRLKP